ncbi:pimeloyl-ACP methyl ester carboxylesterase [Algoriphagus sp. 4150]|uniref:alpha/beta fold hydrolase n=1 Tax=Algoriphagus sp. 4150 TaxID=2817756 RepID=UPI00285D4CAD|nr:alpha/beta hydrolase [Algoriphagus sp. 4150]MDR7130608.1 pimeloyl-ACP methyl ester carboxylesterase [Algoriphagus sp. 4150]
MIKIHIKGSFLMTIAVVCTLGLVGCKNQREAGFQKILLYGKPQHVFIAGEGAPTVVFITGAGSDLEDFRRVQEEISKVTRTFSYDKPGIGKSEMVDESRTIENMTSELLTLLDKTGTTEKLLLVGHSLGGFVARDFVVKHPEKVIGMVLVDPGNEYLTERALLTFPEEDRGRLDSLIHTPDPTSSIGFQAEIASRRSWDGYMRKNDRIFSIPVVLIESARLNEEGLLTEEIIQIKQELNRNLESQFPKLKVITTTESGHFIQLDEPELVISAILELL